MSIFSPMAMAQEAPWIAYPSASVNDYGVYHFRKAFHLDQVPESLVIQLSADNRYHLFVNGQRVCYGPAKGDLQTYKYDVVDLSPWLVEGKNQLAALVYNGGKDMALALQSVQSAFMLRTEGGDHHGLSTDGTWKVLKNKAYAPVSYDEMLFRERWFYGFYACGPGDRVEARDYPWDWEQASYDDSAWPAAEVLSFDGEAPWKLVERNIPFMADYREAPAAIRLTEGARGAEGFLEGTSTLAIPARGKARILFDYEIFTMGYPELTVKGGRGASIKMSFAEALYEKVNVKAHRDSVKGLTMYGVWDQYFPDGPQRRFRPLWKRTFRYVQLEVECGDEAMEILSLENEYSGYPYPHMAEFISDDPRLNEVFDMCRRTLRMCSGETYYDTPYYEQLSYGGDNRPIAALSSYTSTDDRLLREVMRLYPQSVNSETGLFKSAYPSRFTFDMGSWSLAWIQSLHDYYFMRGDADYVKQFMDDLEGVLGFFHRHMDQRLGILGEVACQNFMDWSITKGSIPRKNEDGIIAHSTMLTLYYAHTLDCVVRLYRAIGEEARAEAYARESAEIKAAVKEHSYDREKHLFTDHPGEAIYSQHSNILAILSDVVDAREQKALLERVLSYPDFDERASSYFSFLLFKAMQKCGMEDRILDHLDFWYQFINRGHSTCGETGFASHDRSDCHAWSAHPAYFLLSSVCGIQPADVGFNKVLIRPHPGHLKSIQASMPHPRGRITVNYMWKKGKLNATIVLPPGMEGNFQFGGESQVLYPGENRFRMAP